MSKNFYITTTLPYVNAPLHLGHAAEIIRVDTIARYRKLLGYDVFFNTGTDEHGQKILESATNAGKTPKEYVDECAKNFRENLKSFGVTEDVKLVRTTDENHILAAQKFWKRCADNGFIYKKNYKSKYCVGCESEKTDSELENGKCPIHPNRQIEIIEEENYFFKLSQFDEKLLAYYDKENPDFIIPSSRMNEMRQFVSRGLQDFSISRLKSKMPWGISVPGDDDHVMYVWFDALVNYISTLGWPDDEETFNKFWKNGTPTQYCGKDNTRFQGLMWQAMLLAADLPQTSKVVVDGFILGEGGIKMSKSLGNTIDPIDLANRYSVDSLRFFVLKDFHSFEDTSVSEKMLWESYNANLANGLGNLVSRTMTMCFNYGVDLNATDKKVSFPEVLEKKNVDLDSFNIQNYMNFIWQEINSLDKQIQEKEPYKKIKTDEEGAKNDLREMIKNLLEIAILLEPCLPYSAKKIQEAILENKKPDNLFPRLEDANKSEASQ